MVENTEMQTNADRGAVRRDYKTAFIPSELAHKFSSKQDLLTYFSEHCRCFCSQN